MPVRVQLKVEPNPPAIGMVTMKVKVKNLAGYPMRIEHVHLSVTKDGQQVVNGLEGLPVGDFKAVGDGFYTAELELAAPGLYQLSIDLRHQFTSYTVRRDIQVDG